MKIAFLADAIDLQYAGIHVYTREILKAIHETDQKNEYVIVRSKAGGEFPRFQEIVIPINPKIPMHERWRQFLHFPLQLRKAGVDIVVEPCHFGPFNLPSRIKRVTVIHDLTPLLMPEFHIRNSQIAHKIFLPGILRRAAHIITNSEYTRQDVIRTFPFTKEKSTAILLGKDKIFRPDARPEILQKYGIASNYILFIGTLEPRKNLPTLLKAFEQFHVKHDSDLQLVLVGKKGWRIGPFLHQLETSPVKDKIILPGYVQQEHLPVLYSLARIFVYPSLYEGFGLPVLEAMACGTPVLTSRVSSLPEVGGDAALYFAPDSAEALCSLLEKLDADGQLRSKMGKKGLERAARFSWEKAGRETVAVLEAL